MHISLMSGHFLLEGKIDAKILIPKRVSNNSEGVTSDISENVNLVSLEQELCWLLSGVRVKVIFLGCGTDSVISFGGYNYIIYLAKTRDRFWSSQTWKLASPLSLVLWCKWCGGGSLPFAGRQLRKWEMRWLQVLHWRLFILKNVYSTI